MVHLGTSLLSSFWDLGIWEVVLWPERLMTCTQCSKPGIFGKNDSRHTAFRNTFNSYVQLSG